nr:hypothetical protein [uncultured Shinella sp.]
MHRKTVFFNVMAVVLASALGVAGCTTAPSPDTGAYASSSEARLREHQRKQRLRAEEGGYKRLYRPRDCRQDVKRKCSGFPTYNPS